mmetsp:Transcript_68250/g.158385  ORF Transcript_68250/g.158385 Transcript_68250/m.158385 type:complete len:218 (+) Transcript_68250:999-1652(+)
MLPAKLLSHSSCSCASSWMCELKEASSSPFFNLHSGVLRKCAHSGRDRRAGAEQRSQPSRETSSLSAFLEFDLGKVVCATPDPERLAFARAESSARILPRSCDHADIVLHLLDSSARAVLHVVTLAKLAHSGYPLWAGSMHISHLASVICSRTVMLVLLGAAAASPVRQLLKAVRAAPTRCPRDDTMLLAQLGVEFEAAAVWAVTCLHVVRFWNWAH